jgi:hypothetical protein
MKYITTNVLMIAAIAMATACSDRPTATDPYAPPDSGVYGARALEPGQGFGFNATVSGAPTGVVFITGGGSFDPATATNTVPGETRAVASGTFRCTATVAQGPLSGCAAGEGARWDTVQLLASTGFRCSGADLPKSATTGKGTAVLLADFYRAGDGEEESFTAPMIVSDSDIAPDLAGEQNVWIQGVGCGTAVVHFGR